MTDLSGNIFFLACVMGPVVSRTLWKTDQKAVHLISVSTHLSFFFLFKRKRLLSLSQIGNGLMQSLFHLSPPLMLIKAVFISASGEAFCPTFLLQVSFL